MRFLDLGLSSGTFCKNVISVKMVIYPSSIPIMGTLLRVNQEANGAALVAPVERLRPAKLLLQPLHPAQHRGSHPGQQAPAWGREPPLSL